MDLKRNRIILLCILALIFPIVLLLHYVLPMDISFVYFPVTLITGFLFLCKFQIPKLHLRGLLVLVGIGVAIALLMLFFLMRSNIPFGSG